MPCALEALTVIKTSCGRSTILRLYENRWNAKNRMSSTHENKQKPTPKPNKNQHKPRQTKKASTKLSETDYAFRTMKSSEHSVPLHDDIENSASRKVTHVAHCNEWFPCIHHGRCTGETRWFTHVLVDAAAQGRSSSCKVRIATSVRSHLYDRISWRTGQKECQ